MLPFKRPLVFNQLLWLSFRPIIIVIDFCGLPWGIKLNRYFCSCKFPTRGKRLCGRLFDFLFVTKVHLDQLDILFGVKWRNVVTIRWIILEHFYRLHNNQVQLAVHGLAKTTNDRLLLKTPSTSPQLRPHITSTRRTSILSSPCSRHRSLFHLRRIPALLIRWSRNFNGTQILVSIFCKLFHGQIEAG